jgi:hypothetical protein
MHATEETTGQTQGQEGKSGIQIFWSLLANDGRLSVPLPRVLQYIVTGNPGAVGGLQACS